MRTSVIWHMQLSVAWHMPGHAGNITRKSGLVRIKTAAPASPAQIYAEAERKGNELVQFPFPRRGRRTAFLTPPGAIFGIFAPGGIFKMPSATLLRGNRGRWHPFYMSNGRDAIIFSDFMKIKQKNEPS